MDGAAASTLSEFVGDGISGTGDAGGEGAGVGDSGACACAGASGVGDSAGDVGTSEGAAGGETVREDAASEDAASEEATTA
jgi:hypothetical protein